MTRLKHALITVVVMIATSVQTADAQIPTTDLSNLAQNITAWITELEDAAMQLQTLGLQLDKAREMYQHTKEVYNKINGYIEKGMVFYELYQQEERLRQDIIYLGEYIEYLNTYGNITPGKARALRTMMTRIGEQMLMITNFVKEIFNSANALDGQQRKEEIEKQTLMMEKLSTDIEDWVRQDAKNILENAMRRSDFTQMCYATGTNMVTESEEKEIEKYYSELVTEIREKVLDEKIDRSLYEEDITYGKSSKVDSVFNFVTSIIGILTALMFVWAYARYTREPQHRDAIWKVAAGLLFVMLLMQVIKVALFESGAFNMTVPNF